MPGSNFSAIDTTGTLNPYTMPNDSVTTTNLTATNAIIANLEVSSTSLAPIVSTSITTVGNGILTAAGLVGGQIVRTGPVANYTDTTDTAVNIIAALPTYVLGGTFLIRIKNATAFTQTIVAGTGVTLPLTVIVPAFSVANYYATINTATTITLTHMSTAAISIGTVLTARATTTINTVGAGSISAANFVGGITIRSGSQSASAFTDTTDTASNIIAACANIVNKIGTSFIYYYQNTTNAPATITGGTGVTVSVITTVQANSTAIYLVTYTAAATLTMAGISQSSAPSTGTFTANGVTPVTVSNTTVSVNSQIGITLKTVGGSVGAQPHCTTITPGTGFTVVATAADTSTYNYEIRW